MEKGDWETWRKGYKEILKVFIWGTILPID